MNTDGGSGMMTRKIAEPTDMGEYEIRHEEWRAGIGDENGDPWVPIDSAWTKVAPGSPVTPAYIGEPERGAFLAAEGIVPELRSETSNVCTIGYNALEQRWYGWSHRAMYGFAVGDRTDARDSWDSMVDFPVKVIHALDEAKACAIAFAESVS